MALMQKTMGNPHLYQTSTEQESKCAYNSSRATAQALEQQQFTMAKSECVQMILPQVHLRKPCYDFSFL